MVMPTVIFVSNDVYPGQVMPVAAPGLRVFGLVEGLVELGGRRSIVAVVAGPVEKNWTSSVPSPSRGGTFVVSPKDLQAFIESHAPAVVVLTNSNVADHLRRHPRVRYVVDFFAPKMLELANSDTPDLPAALERLRARKIRAIELADAFIVNGQKKLPYFLAWLLQSTHDVNSTPLVNVPMTVPASFGQGSPGGEQVRFGMAGYLQEWSRPGSWLLELVERLSPPEVTLDLLLPAHWGTARSLSTTDLLSDVVGRPGVTSHDIKPWSEFQAFLGSLDVSVDLFDWSLEREYAMVTRTVVALSCGTPVIHPPFTEVSPLIERYDAGWLVDPADTEALGSVLDEIIGDPAAARAKRANVERLWEAEFAPARSVAPLAEILESLGAELGG